MRVNHLMAMGKNIYLIDGHALIFKMYYAFLKRPMINSKGMDTSILFGFTKYILELIEREKPTHLAVAFDPPGGTFRNTLYPEYKATREATPQLVIDALEPLQELCGALKIPVLMIPGFEADDVIGSMARKCEDKGFDVYMVTPDKDYGQLITDHVIQYKPGKSGGERELIDKNAVCGKYGISSPEQVIEMLTICGDVSDNVPGVKGIGEVGAGKLIAKYGSVENIYNHLDELTAKQKAAFEDARGHIRLSHTLVTIRTDLDISLDPENAAVTSDYSPDVADLFEKYEFSSLTKYISHIEPSGKREKKTLQPEKVSPAEFCATVRKTGIFSLITETGSESVFSHAGKLTVGTVSDGKYYCSGGTCRDFEDIVTDPEIKKCGYDLKAQTNAFLMEKTDIAGPLMDIELMHYLINPEKSHKVSILAMTYLGISLEENEGGPVQKSLFDDRTEETPGSRDAEAIAIVLLADRIMSELSETGEDRLYWKIEEPLIRVLARMERTGVKVDMAQLQKFSMELRNELKQRQDRIREMAGEPELNISSPMQVGIVLFEKLGLDPKARKTGTRGFYSTDEETLSALQYKHPIINEILEFRAVKKLLSSYIEPFPSFVNPVTGKVHTTFNQALTATGRLSSSKPNLQNIPVRTERGREIRKAFVPSRPDGVILSADYSQIELRIMAHLSNDKHLVEAFRQGLDVHAITASKIFGIKPEEVTADQRRIAKTANFGIMYGISAFGLAQRLKISRAEAKKIIDDYFANFPDISSFISGTIASAREKGYVETLFGRRRYLPDITSRNATVRSLAERNAVNAPIQGTSADIIKIAMAEVDREIRRNSLESSMVLQIHDELVFDAVPGEIETLKCIVTDKMQNVIKLSVPLTVECNYGKNWLEAH